MNKKGERAARKFLAKEDDKVKEYLAPPGYDPLLKDIVPVGGGMACRYEDMPDDAMVQEFNKSHMIAKMHLINRIISLATYETDLAKVSGALRDLNSIASEIKEPGKAKGGWSLYVEEAIKKTQTVVIKNQQINNYGANKD